MGRPENISINDVDLKFDHWRKRHKMPARTGGKEFNLGSEMIFVDHDGTEIGISPDSPLFQEYIEEYERRNQS